VLWPYWMLVAALALGIGNVRSVVRALERSAGATPAEIVMTADPDVVRRADVIVAPGQGAFGSFATAIAQHGMDEALREAVRAGKPYFGICLGLQVLFETSAESTESAGLGILAGRVERLDPGSDLATGRPYALPHMGWNRAEPTRSGVVTGDHYYFAHTFAAVPADERCVLARTTYGATSFVSAIEHENMLGIQFHPEKSQRAGLAILERFFQRAR